MISTKDYMLLKLKQSNIDHMAWRVDRGRVAYVVNVHKGEEPVCCEFYFDLQGRLLDVQPKTWCG